MKCACRDPRLKARQARMRTQTGYNDFDPLAHAGPRRASTAPHRGLPLRKLPRRTPRRQLAASSRGVGAQEPQVTLQCLSRPPER